MKTVRVLLFVVVLLAVLIAIVVTLALNSGFQTWAARKAIGTPPGLAIALGRVDAGLQQTRVENVRVRTADVVVNVPSVVADVPLWAAARRKVNVHKLVAHGWTIDLTQRMAATQPQAGVGVQAVSTQAAAVFQGIFAQLQLPVDLSVDQVDLEGDVTLPAAAGAAPMQIHVKLTGGQFAAGRAGSFTLDAAATLEGDSPVRSLQAHSVISATMDTPRTFSRLAVETAVVAAGPQLAQPAHLTMSTTAERASGGETYAADVASEGKDLFILRAQYPAHATAVTGTWQIAMTDADVAPYVLGVALPRFNANGRG
jgi:hypothetical protein